MDPPPGHPGPADKAFGRPAHFRLHRFLSFRALSQSALDVGQQCVHGHPAGGAEEVDPAHFGVSPPHPHELALDLGRLTARLRAPEIGPQRARLASDLGVVRVAGRVEQGPDLGVAQAVDEAGLADHAVPAALLNLA